MEKTKTTIKYLIAVFIYGTIGLFLRNVNVASEFVVLCRGTIGSVFIGLILLINKKKIDYQAIKSNFKLLAISGICLGLNWIFLFAGYEYAIALTSLCNYLAPIIVIVISTLYLKEKISNKQIICVILAFVGIVFVSGIFDDGTINVLCIVLGLLAALGFVGLVLCNRKLQAIDPLEKTVIQLSMSALTVLPYVLINHSIPSSLDIKSIILLLIMGILHTGIAYIFYFGSINVLPVETVAIFGYIEPVLNILIGALVFKEKLTVLGVIGAVLIIGAAIYSELSSIKSEN